MEGLSSVYMCFPCYQEFDTLDEVLKHQLTCTAEATDPPQATAGTASITVPLLHTQQQVVATTASILAPLIQTQPANVSAAPKKGRPSQAAAKQKALSSSDQPRILYQCGDCDELFKSLYLWQQHRKEGSCLKSKTITTETDVILEPKTEPEAEPDEPGQPEEGEPEDAQDLPSAFVEAKEPECQPAADSLSAQSSNPPVSEQSAASASDPEDSPRKRGAIKKPKPDPVLLCVDCGSSFGLVSELVAHRKTQHGLEEALHRCLVCGESFLNTTLFLYHRKQHRQKGEERETVVEMEMTNDCPPVVQEEVVEESLAEMSGVVYTQSNGTEEQGQDAVSAASTSIFTQPETFMCTQCGATFNKEAAFASHRKDKHGLSEALHCCFQCGQNFMNTTQYLYHRRLPHHHAPGAETEVATTTTSQDVPKSSKRLLSPPASSGDSCSPQAKRGKPTIRISSLSALKENNGEAGAMKEAEEEMAVTDSDATNLPPPAKLMHDWARTPLPHVCPHCGKTFTRRVFLRAHVYSHTGEKLFTCKVCKKAFTNSQSLLRHSMIHMGNKPFNCDECGKNFSQAATLKRHQRIHASTLPRRKRGRKPVCTLDSEGAAHLYSCPHCPSRFITEDQLTHHKLLHTSHPFPCKECGVAFKRRKELDLHSLAHQDKEPATCPHCSSQFINQSVLDIHMQRCPSSEDDRSAGRGRGQGRGRCTGQVECDLCGHRCMTQEGLDLHRLSHTGQTPLKCPVMPCRRRFASNGALEEHVLAHCQGTLSKTKSRPRFRCQICAKDFAYTSTFNVHMRTHTDERPFECATCHKRFRQLPHLQDHERIHSGLRPFCCWVCGKSFSVAARLTEHARTHSGEKPYPCPRCPSAFRSRSNLDKHIRLHGDLPAEHDAQALEVMEGAKVLTSLATTAEGHGGSVQTIYLLQGAEGTTETVMIPSDQLSAAVILGGQAISVPTIHAMEGSEITMMEAGQETQHTIEFIVEETV